MDWGCRSPGSTGGGADRHRDRHHRRAPVAARDGALPDGGDAGARRCSSSRRGSRTPISTDRPNGSEPRRGAALRIPDPEIFGIDLAVGSGDGYPHLLRCAVPRRPRWPARSGSCSCPLPPRRSDARGPRQRGAPRPHPGSTSASTRVDIASSLMSFIAGLWRRPAGYHQQTVATASTFAVPAGIGLFAAFYIAGVTSISGATARWHHRSQAPCWRLSWTNASTSATTACIVTGILLCSRS